MGVEMFPASFSLATHHDWLSSVVSISHYTLDHSGNDMSSVIDVRNLSLLDHIEKHKGWIDTLQWESLEQGKDLWLKRKEYFPNLLFGSDMEAQLQKIGLSNKHNRVFNSLKQMDGFCISWQSGGFSLEDFKSQTLLDASYESASTMQKFFVERKFRLPDGKKVQFELHVKLPDLRIYILPDIDTKTLTVGYIGKHLRTSKYN